MSKVIRSEASKNRTGLPQHNPMPRTDRGKRRHENRNDTQKKQAEAAWRKERAKPIVT